VNVPLRSLGCARACETARRVALSVEVTRRPSCIVHTALMECGEGGVDGYVFNIV
jgi:hypothetical protein